MSGAWSLFTGLLVVGGIAIGSAMCSDNCGISPIDALLIVAIVGFPWIVWGIVAARRSGDGLGAKMPFGPFLAGAGWITMLWGDAIKQFFNLPF